MIKTIAKLLLAMLLITLVAGLKYFYFPSDHVVEVNTYENWQAQEVNHILPSFDHQKLILKVSLKAEVDLPTLQITDKQGHLRRFSPISMNAEAPDRFLSFYADQLTPETKYNLQLFSDQTPLSDPWNIITHPHPDSTVNELTIMAFTCAGGIDGTFLGQEVFNEVKARQALLKKGLTFNPDVVIANGDHMYWDQLSFQINTLKKLLSARRDSRFGKLDLDQPMLSQANQAVFTKMADAQIAELYGAYLREHAVLFVADDHDLLENDEALPELVTFPPAEYMLDAGRTAQMLYYPEFLRNNISPKGTSPYHPKLQTSFGGFQFGNLAEINLYDSKRFCDLNGDEAVMFPLQIENWLGERAADTTHRWLFQTPSSPLGWTAGKWHEWYPDVLDESGKLTINKEKYLWQKGWWNQHQRLLQAFASNKNRPTVILQGDLHMAGMGKITKSGSLDLSQNKIYAIGTGPLGSGKLGFPSSVRGSGSEVPIQMEVEELMPPIEKNGFTILKVTPDQVHVSIFLWRTPQLISEIADMAPAFEYTIQR